MYHHLHRLLSFILVLMIGLPSIPVYPQSTGTIDITATLTASPNPVPEGTGLGTTIISWDTGDGSAGQVYVSENDGPEYLFAYGISGSQEAIWIATGSIYTFRLYAGTSHITLLHSLIVRRALSLIATPNPVPAGDGLGTTTIAWSTGDGSDGQVYISENDGPEYLFAWGAYGSQEATWIATGSIHTFRLYAGTSHTTVLRTIVVRRALSLIATPNPVPAGDGLGTTTIAWSTGDGSDGQVYVSANNGVEQLFAQGAYGSKGTATINAGSVYVFRLYAGADHTTLLRSVTVTRSVEQHSVFLPLLHR